jgi:ACS family pantothenate transporter-like MFS transporter
LYTFWGIALYPASDAPYWKKGYITMIVVVFAFFAATAAVHWLDQRSQRIENDVAEELTHVSERSNDRKED